MKLTVSEDKKIFVKSDGDYPLWLIISKPEDQARVEGFFGRSMESGLAIVRPFKFQTQERTNTLDAQALAAFIISAFEAVPVIDHSQKISSKSQENLSAWESFLSQKNNDISIKEITDAIKIPSEAFFGLERSGVMLTSDSGSLNYSHKIFSGFKRGNPISGFNSYAVQKSIKTIFPDLPDLPDINVPQAKTALESISKPSSQAVVFYGSKDPELAKLRLQASKAFPILAGMIADNPLIAEKVDTMEPIQPLLIERTGLTKGSLKKLGKLAFAIPAEPVFSDEDAFEGRDALGVLRDRRFVNRGNVSLDTALLNLSQMPPDYTPKDDKEWRAYLAILICTAVPLGNALGKDPIEFLKPSKGNWVAYKDSLARAADFPAENFDAQTMLLTSMDAVEMLESFSRFTIMPLALSSIRSTDQDDPDITREYTDAGFEAATDIIIGKSNNIAANLYEHVRRYASRFNFIHGEQADPVFENRDERFQRYGTDSMPVIFADFTASNGRVLRFLDTREKFTEESDRLRHCVGRSNYYFFQCMKMQKHIVSFQDPSGENSHSTAELHSFMDNNLKGFPKIYQHKSYGNGLASDLCKAALEEFKTAYLSGNVHINKMEANDWAAYVERNEIVSRDTQNRNLITWHSVLGLDWTDNQRVLDMWNEWRQVLGGRFETEEKPDILFRSAKVRNLVSQMNPKAALILQERAAAEKSDDPSP